MAASLHAAPPQAPYATASPRASETAASAHKLAILSGGQQMPGCRWTLLQMGPPGIASVAATQGSGTLPETFSHRPQCKCCGRVATPTVKQVRRGGVNLDDTELLQACVAPPGPTVAQALQALQGAAPGSEAALRTAVSCIQHVAAQHPPPRVLKAAGREGAQRSQLGLDLGRPRLVQLLGCARAPVSRARKSWSPWVLDALGLTAVGTAFRVRHQSTWQHDGAHSEASSLLGEGVGRG